MIWLTAYCITAIVIIIAGMCMANIKLVLNGECSMGFVRDVFIAGLLWIIPVLALIWITFFCSREQIIQIFKGFNL